MGTTEGQAQQAEADLILIQYEDRPQGRIAKVIFNNPAQQNSVGLAGKRRFIEVMQILRRNESLRAVIITGAGDKSFIGGTNITEMAGFGLEDAETSAIDMHRMADSVRTFPIPVIARINGYCFGSGMEIAGCADLRVAAEHAQFCMPEVRYGVPAGMEAAILPRLIGWGKTRELVLTGDRINAAEAFRIGYLQRVVPYDQLDAAVEGWLDSILACGPNALRLQKKNLLNWEQMSLTDAARAGIQMFVDAYRCDEPRRMMTAFINRKNVQPAKEGS